jgi:hypothetical protein
VRVFKDRFAKPVKPVDGGAAHAAPANP